MLVPLVTLAWFAYGGGLHDLFEVQVGYNLQEIGDLTLESVLKDKGFI